MIELKKADREFLEQTREEFEKKTRDLIAQIRIDDEKCLASYRETNQGCGNEDWIQNLSTVLVVEQEFSNTCDINVKEIIEISNESTAASLLKAIEIPDETFYTSLSARLLSVPPITEALRDEFIDQKNEKRLRRLEGIRIQRDETHSRIIEINRESNEMLIRTIHRRILDSRHDEKCVTSS